VNQQIVISDKIQFALGSDQILPASTPVLTAVATVFSQHPEIKKVEIAGHASNDGPAAYNMQLSQLRATSVMKWLIAHGVSKDILVAKGYGITKPLDRGTSQAALERNRRVEFNILDPAQIPDATSSAMPPPPPAPTPTPAPTPAPTAPAPTATAVPPTAGTTMPLPPTPANQNH
jgi:OOP family OmpA-OmpF porin